MKFITPIALVSLALSPFAQSEIKVISPDEAHQLVSETETAKRPVILDTRGGYKDYFRGHLPSAHHINFDTLRGTDKGVPVQYLPDDITRTLLMRAGVDKSRVHLLYATGDKLPNDEILSTTMVAYVLEKFGIEKIQILNGGIPAYKAAGHPMTQEYFGNPSGTLPDKTQPDIAVDVQFVVENKTKPGFVLVDARPKNEYLGQDDVWLRKGHIPGAISFHWARLMSPENTHTFKPFTETKADLEAAGITSDKDIIVYCGTSREGSLLRFYLKHVAGYPKVRLYEGSWKEYASLKELPAETTESIVTR